MTEDNSITLPQWIIDVPQSCSARDNIRGVILNTVRAGTLWLHAADGTQIHQIHVGYMYRGDEKDDKWQIALNDFFFSVTNPWFIPMSWVHIVR